MYGATAQQPMYWVHPSGREPAATAACNHTPVSSCEQLKGWDAVYECDDEDASYLFDSNELWVGPCQCSYACCVCIWPDKVKLSQPSRLPAGDARAVLLHWQALLDTAPSCTGSEQQEAGKQQHPEQQGSDDEQDTQPGDSLTPEKRRLQWLLQCEPFISGLLQHCCSGGKPDVSSSGKAGSCRVPLGNAAAAADGDGYDVAGHQSGNPAGKRKQRQSQQSTHWACNCIHLCQSTAPHAFNNVLTLVLPIVAGAAGNPEHDVSFDWVSLAAEREPPVPVPGAADPKVASGQSAGTGCNSSSAVGVDIGQTGDGANPPGVAVAASAAAAGAASTAPQAVFPNVPVINRLSGRAATANAPLTEVDMEAVQKLCGELTVQRGSADWQDVALFSNVPELGSLVDMLLSQRSTLAHQQMQHGKPELAAFSLRRLLVGWQHLFV